MKGLMNLKSKGKNMKPKKGFGKLTKNVLSAAIIAACGLTSMSSFAGHGPHSGHDNGGSTPFARIVKMPVVKVKGQIDHAATYAKAKAVATAIGMYIANTNDATASGFPAVVQLGRPSLPLQAISPTAQDDSPADSIPSDRPAFPLRMVLESLHGSSADGEPPIGHW